MSHYVQFCAKQNIQTGEQNRVQSGKYPIFKKKKILTSNLQETPIANVFCLFFLMERFSLSFQSDMIDGQPDNSWISNPILCSVAMLFACR